MPSGKSPLVLKEFKGELLTDAIFAAGGAGIDKYRQSRVPFEFSLNNENLLYLKKGGLYTRPGIKSLSNLTVTGRIHQMWRIDNLNGTEFTDRFLILTWDGADGRLYDTNPAVATNPVLTITGMKYAYIINAFGRMYISAWSAWATPLANSYVWLYNDKYSSGARLTMGQEPTPGAMAVAAAAAGTNPQCTPGLHFLSVVFETDSGFRTTCPTSHIRIPLSVTTTTANAQINVTAIPVWGGVAGLPAAMVTRRHILMTKVVVNNNQNGFDSYEPFIAYTIEDNVTTTASINVPDSGLVDSAKLLINQSQSGVRAHVGMAVYKSRMVWLGSRSYSGGDTFGLVNSITYSPINQPEQVRNVLNDGLRVIIGPDFSGRVMTGAELNGTFYIFKEDSTFAHVADDTVDPSEWAQPSLVDAAKGAFPFGVASVGNNPASLMDNHLLVAGNHGLTLFSGAYQQNSLADTIWARFSVEELKWMKVLVDPIRKLAFLRFGDPGIANASADGPLTYLYFADYYYGLENTRWGKFLLPLDGANQIYANDVLLRQPSTGDFKTLYSLLTVLAYQVAMVPTCQIYSETNKIVDFTSTDIAWKYETGYTPNEQGEVNEFGPLKLRANSRTDTVTKTVTVKRGVMDSSTLTTVGSLIVGSDPSKYYSLPLNEANEHIRLEVSGSGAIIIEALMLFFKQRALERPRP